jgi:hypothetical protein
MPNTFEKRARAAIRVNDVSFQPRGAQHRALFEAMKKEMRGEVADGVEQGKRQIRAETESALKRLRTGITAAEAQPSVDATPSIDDGEVAPLTTATTALALIPQEPAKRAPWELLCEARVQRNQAAMEERARARHEPDLAQHLRRAYDRLAVQHDWPALADGAALPGDILAYVKWFYEVNTPFQNAL